MEVHTIKVGKTTTEEIKSVMDFFNELSWLSDEMNDFDFDDVDINADFSILSNFDKKHPENFIKDIADHAKSLFYERVLINCQVLLDNVVDPNLTHLDWKPELKELLEPKGFKDKNGKQFGAGDVLQYTEHKGYWLKTGKMLVCWIEDYGCYGYKFEHSEYSIPFTSHDELQEDIFQYCELIGNIGENPELLTIFE